MIEQFCEIHPDYKASVINGEVKIHHCNYPYFKFYNLLYIGSVLTCSKSDKFIEANLNVRIRMFINKQLALAIVSVAILILILNAFHNKAQAQDCSTNCPYVQFSGNVSSRLFFDNSNMRLNLTVCADNLPGKALYYEFYRGPVAGYPEKSQGDFVKPTTRCHTLWDLDGPGPTFAGVTYFTKVALNGFPKSEWKTPCYSTTNRYGLCDSKRR